MAKQRKDQPDEVRKDASGREMFPWEVDPADQISRHPAAQAADDAGGGVDRPVGTGESAE